MSNQISILLTANDQAKAVIAELRAEMVALADQMGFTGKEAVVASGQIERAIRQIQGAAAKIKIPDLFAAGVSKLKLPDIDKDLIKLQNAYNNVARLGMQPMEAGAQRLRDGIAALNVIMEQSGAVSGGNAVKMAELNAQLYKLTAGAEGSIGMLAKFGLSVHGILEMATGFATATIAAELFSKSIEFFKDLVHDTIHYIDTLKYLDTALHDAGTNWANVGESAMEAANQIQRTTRFARTEALEALTKMTIITNDYGAAIKLLGPVTDLAAAMHVDLATAAGKVALALEGNEKALNKFIGKMTPAQREIFDFGTEAERVALLMDRLKEKTENYAVESTKTLSGQWAIAKHEVWADMRDSILAAVNVLTTAGDAWVKVLSTPRLVAITKEAKDLNITLEEQAQAYKKVREQGIDPGKFTAPHELISSWQNVTGNAEEFVGVLEDMSAKYLTNRQAVAAMLASLTEVGADYRKHEEEVKANTKALRDQQNATTQVAAAIDILDKAHYPGVAPEIAAATRALKAFQTIVTYGSPEDIALFGGLDKIYEDMDGLKKKIAELHGQTASAPGLFSRDLREFTKLEDELAKLELLRAAATGRVDDRQGFPIDLKRPEINNKDGTISTERTITIELNGKWVNIPSIVDGVEVPMEKAVADAQEKAKSGWKFPTFDTLTEALDAAVDRSKAIGQIKEKLKDFEVAPKDIDIEKLDLIGKRIEAIKEKLAKMRGETDQKPGDFFKELTAQLAEALATFQDTASTQLTASGLPLDWLVPAIDEATKIWKKAGAKDAQAYLDAAEGIFKSTETTKVFQAPITSGGPVHDNADQADTTAVDFAAQAEHYKVLAGEASIYFEDVKGMYEEQLADIRGWSSEEVAIRRQAIKAIYDAEVEAIWARYNAEQAALQAAGKVSLDAQLKRDKDLAEARAKAGKADATLDKKVAMSKEEAGKIVSQNAVTALGVVFKNKKLAAIAQAFIDMKEGIAASLLMPPGFREANIALVTAIGMATIASIKSTDYSKAAKGGMVGGSDMGDTHPFMLEAGEIVVPKQIAKSIVNSKMLSEVDTRMIAFSETGMGAVGRDADSQKAIQTFNDIRGVADNVISTKPESGRAAKGGLVAGTEIGDKQRFLLESGELVLPKTLTNTILQGRVALVPPNAFAAKLRETRAEKPVANAAPNQQNITNFDMNASFVGVEQKSAEDLLDDINRLASRRGFTLKSTRLVRSGRV